MQYLIESKTPTFDNADQVCDCQLLRSCEHVNLEADSGLLRGCNDCSSAGRH